MTLLCLGQATFTIPASISFSGNTQQIQLRHLAAASAWRSANYTFNYFETQPHVQQITLGSGSRMVNIKEDGLVIVASQVSQQLSQSVSFAGWLYTDQSRYQLYCCRLSTLAFTITDVSLLA